jgi:hypothetical protein
MGSDAAFVAAGWRFQGSSQWGDFILLGFDGSGNLRWNKTYPSTYSLATSVDHTSDGGFILAGVAMNPQPLQYYSVFIGVELIKTDANGNLEWNKTVTGSKGLWPVSVHQATDGGYIIAADDDGLIPWILKTDSDGNLLWNKTYSRSVVGFNNDVRLIQTTVDGGCIMLSDTWVALHSGLTEGSWIVKTDANGTPQWNRTIAGTRANEQNNFKYIEQTRDGGFIAAGVTGGRAWLLKLDSNGNSEWNTTYNAADWSSAIQVHQTLDGGYAAMLGAPWFGEYRAWLWKINSNGTTQWCRSLGEDLSFLLLQQTSDGNYIALGTDVYNRFFIVMKAVGIPPPYPTEPIPLIYGISVTMLAVSTALFALNRRREREREQPPSAGA